ncbi:DNA damage-inducible protein D [Pectinatus frisingensis]|uniref:DNA damage-inducible protein D n=1 Tax=Pectinatus frisingensis TaxID=865 RepID=UPI0018C774DB|nr:DNA damage-inducible protein D [Pectinatus frisingensis]
MANIEHINETLFESIKHINKYAQEYWTARELQSVLEYTEWRKFKASIKRAIAACESSDNTKSDHFVDAAKMVQLGSGAYRELEDYHLSRYACYLIAMNGDSRKKAIALAQTYFAVKTRQQEVADEFNQMTEDQKRLAIRGDLVEHNKSLVEAAQESGVQTPMDFAIFQNNGYQGLYGGLGQKEIHEKKGLKKSQKILDHMGSTELAANLFRATQTDEKLRRDNIHSKTAANKTHYDVGKAVRTTIKNLGGTMPEDLPTPKTSISKIKKLQPNKHHEINNIENK